MKLTIYGASDDLVEFVFEGGRNEEFDLPYGEKWKGRILAPNGDALTVTAEYGAPGKYRSDWTIGVRNTGTWPAWPMHYEDRPDRDDDPALVIEVPEGTIVKEAK